MADDGTSRAGWHAQHLRHGEPVPGKPASSNTRGDRARLLKEAMRALDESDVAKQAARNHSIVAADTRRNTAYVNDGEGGFRELTKADGVEAVLAYGDDRIDRVKRKWNPKTFETTTIVSWVPKSLLKEVPDFYPVATAGVEVGRRSRWVMPDDEAGKAEVQRWFTETHKHLTTDVLRGGHDSIHGVVWNFDESQVHVHFMADTFAEVHRDMGVAADGQMLDADGEPIVRYKKPLTLDKIVAVSADGTLRDAPHIKATDIARLDERGRLRNADDELLRYPDGRPVRANADLKAEAQQMWGQSSETTVTREVDGEQREVAITGRTKMSAYQETYRQHLIDAGFDVELEANPERTSLTKDSFAELDAQRREAAAAAVSLQLEAEALAAERAELDGRAAALDQREVRLDEREGEIDERAAEVEATTRRQVLDAMEAEARKAKADADRIRADAETEAGQIVGGAQTEAEQIESQAHARGYAAGHAEGVTAGAEAWEREHGHAYRQKVRDAVTTDVEVEHAARKLELDERARRVERGEKSLDAERAEVDDRLDRANGLLEQADRLHREGGRIEKHVDANVMVPALDPATGRVTRDAAGTIVREPIGEARRRHIEHFRAHGTEKKPSHASRVEGAKKSSARERLKGARAAQDAGFGGGQGPADGKGESEGMGS